MALTEDEIQGILRLKQQVEDTLNSPTVMRMKDEIALGMRPSAIETLLRGQEQIQRFMESPILKEVEHSHEALRRAIPRFPVAEEVALMHTNLENIAPTHSLVEELARGHEEMTRFAATPTLAESFRSLSTEMAAAGGFAKISSLAEDISRIIPRIGQDGISLAAQLHSAMENSPVMQLAAQYRDLFSGFQRFALSPEVQALVEASRYSDSFMERVAANLATLAANPEDDESLAAVQTSIGERAATLQRGTVSVSELVGILSLVAMILIWADQKRDSARSDQKLQAIVTIMETIRGQLAPLPEQVEEIRVVIEPLKVRVAPDLDAESVALLQPRQRVNVVARSESWLEVEYFDAESGSVKKGWVAELYTKEISEE